MWGNLFDGAWWTKKRAQQETMRGE
jgi:hypothetical protein